MAGVHREANPAGRVKHLDEFLHRGHQANQEQSTESLRPTKDVAIRGATATPRPPAQKLAADLELVAANQQLEGFSGVISAEAANHEPNMADIDAAARRSGGSNPHRGKQGSRSDP